MAGYVVERSGFVDAPTLIGNIIVDMINNGFTQIFPSVPFNLATVSNSYIVILEAGPDLDPLNAVAIPEVDRQPWRVAFRVTNPQLAWMSVATPLQLSDDGVISLDRIMGFDAPIYINYAGNVGAMVANRFPNGSFADDNLNSAGVYSNQADVDETNKGLVNRPRRITGNQNGVATNPAADGSAGYPMSYRMSLSDRGMWLGIWEDANTTETARSFNWVLVQRPVDRNTGDTLITGKAPVFCVNSIGGQMWQFTVRESDILRPGAIRSADSNTPDSEGIINSQTQVSLSEDGKYIVTFPSRLNTSRYRYPHELDMIGITSSDVVSQQSDVPLTVYGETTPRVYKAMQANGPDNTGMRVLVLKDGGGITGFTSV